MSDQINRETMQVFKSVNTPDFPSDTFMNISGMVLPTCDRKYWKIIGEQVVEMTVEEKTVVDYIEPAPEPEPPTVEELEAERDANIASEIAIKYPLPAEMALRWKLRTGELTTESPEIVAYRAWVDSAKVKYPKV